MKLIQRHQRAGGDGAPGRSALPPHLHLPFRDRKRSPVFVLGVNNDLSACVVLYRTGAHVAGPVAAPDRLSRAVTFIVTQKFLAHNLRHLPYYSTPTTSCKCNFTQLATRRMFATKDGMLSCNLRTHTVHERKNTANWTSIESFGGYASASSSVSFINCVTYTSCNTALIQSKTAYYTTPRQTSSRVDAPSCHGLLCQP